MHGTNVKINGNIVLLDAVPKKGIPLSENTNESYKRPV